MIRILINPEEKKVIARQILEALPEWFGIPESTENYIEVEYKNKDVVMVKRYLQKMNAFAR